MSSSELFSDNLQLLSRYSPIGPFVFAHLKEEECTVVQNPDGTLNLSSNGALLYPKEGIAKEAEDYFASLDMESVRVLYLFGVGLGYDYDAAYKWLRGGRKRYLVFLEDDLAVAKRFLETEQATRVLKDKRVRLHFFSPPVEDNPLITQLAQYYALCVAEVGFLRAYKERKASLCQELEVAIRSESYNQQAIATDEIDQNQHFYRPFYANIQKMAGGMFATDLAGRFPKVPALLCGAGPSLDEAMPLIEKAQDKALIFAGGSALTAFGAHGVRPHFGAGLSPSISERDRFERANLFDVPLFYHPKICPEALSAWGGEKIAALSESKPIVTYLASELGLEKGVIEPGPSVTGLLIELAALMGCDPIILVGVDLAYVKGAPYATGVNALECQRGFPTTVGELSTHLKWISEAHDLGIMASSHPHIRFLNASSGLDIPGIERVVLSEALTPFSSQDLQSRIACTLEGVKRGDLSSKLALALKRLKESMERCSALTGEMMLEFEKIREKVVKDTIETASEFVKLAGRKKGKSFGEVPPHLTSGRLALLQVELEEELAYRVVLEEMQKARTLYFQRVYDEFLIPLKRTPQLLWQRKVMLEQEKVQFLHLAAQGQLALLSS